MMKFGSMIMYDQDIKFDRTATSGGLKKFLKRKLAGEELQLTRAQGKGNLYLADQGKKVEHETVIISHQSIQK